MTILERSPTVADVHVPAVPVAYFSMEIAIDDGLPTYSGGLGVLAGDHLRAAADSGLPMVAVTLLYREGYFRQHLDGDGAQHEEPVQWDPSLRLELLPARVEVSLGDRAVRVAPWRMEIQGVTGHRLPVYFLDTWLPENDPQDQRITDRLYGGDLAHRLRQEAVLGLGGVAMLEELGHEVATYHMNEGHAALLTLALAERANAPRRRRRTDGDARPADGPGPAAGVHCVFTTHTPVPAGHDRFPRHLVAATLGERRAAELAALGCIGGEEDELNMTVLGMRCASFVNAVSRRHAHVSRAMFPAFNIHWITNGVHAGTWVAPAIGTLFDEAIPGWRADNSLLRAAGEIDLDALMAAHRRAKAALLEAVAERSGRRLDPSALTIAVARRATAYKRTALLLSDPRRLQALVARHGPVQILYSGKAHPADGEGKELIRQVTAAGHRLAGSVPVVYLEEYSLTLARLLCAGADLWLNTPTKPMEASGTSGMKAALNGVPSLSILDGWWLEGHVEGVTGWAIGDQRAESHDRAEAQDLYAKLAYVVAPLYFERPQHFAKIMRSTIALNGSYFSAERMVGQYLRMAYRPPVPAARVAGG